MYLTRPLISISSVPWGLMHFRWIPRWGVVTWTRETREIIIIFRPANFKLVPTPTTWQKWRSNKPIKFKGNWVVARSSDGGDVEWCSRFVKTANSVVLDYSVDIIQLGESDFILDYGELGNFRSDQPQSSKAFIPWSVSVLPGLRWSSRDMCLTTLSPIISRQVNIDIKIPI